MRSKLLFTAIIIIACGREPAAQETVLSRQANSVETSEYALKVDNRRDVPACGADNHKQLVWVVETAEMLTCESSIWVAIDLRGKDGLQGKQGEQGIAGRDGIDGAAGQDGSNGIDGQDGLAGTDGTDAANINVLNPDGSILGSLVSVNYSTNEYYVVTDDNLRLQYEHTTGTLKNVYLLFSGLNCTGEMRVMIENGVFGNVFIDGRDNTTTYHATGRNLGTFNYLSRVPKANSCQNTSGDALRSHAAEIITLGYYPVLGTEIQN